MTATMDDRLLRSREAAAVLAVSTRSLDRLVAAGVLVPVRFLPNSNRRFRATDIARLIAHADAETKEQA